MRHTIKDFDRVLDHLLFCPIVVHLPQSGYEISAICKKAKRESLDIDFSPFLNLSKCHCAHLMSSAMFCVDYVSGTNRDISGHR
jgi:hypothetical protein